MSDSIMHALGRTVLIGSGAIGTSLRLAGGKNDEPVELQNLRQPSAVRNLHIAYREAGSRILVTNTFAANKIVFGDSGIADLCDETNRMAVIPGPGSRRFTMPDLGIHRPSWVGIAAGGLFGRRPAGHLSQPVP